MLSRLLKKLFAPFPVIPASAYILLGQAPAGIQVFGLCYWIPVFTGMTNETMGYAFFNKLLGE